MIPEAPENTYLRCIAHSCNSNGLCQSQKAFDEGVLADRKVVKEWLWGECDNPLHRWIPELAYCDPPIKPLRYQCPSCIKLFKGE